MNIAHNLVNSKLGGSLQVESEEGKGVKFIIELYDIVI